MAEGKTSMFGKTYNTIGSTDSNFIIKTKGDLKILWGSKFIDVIKDGKISTKGDSIMKKVDSEEDIRSNGIFIIDDLVWINVDGTKILLNNADLSYISFLLKLELKSEEKTLALSNIGFYYESINDLALANISSGIVYIKDEKSLYLVDDGNIIKYAVGNNTSDELVLDILKIGNITISGEKISSDSQLILGILDEQYIRLSEGSIICNKNIQLINDLYIQSYGASLYEGFRLYNNNQGSTLEVDNLIWRNLKDQLRNYLNDKTIYSSKSNIISKIISSNEYITPEGVEGYKVICDLQYFNTFEAKEYIYSTISEETLLYIITLSHEILMEGGVKVFIKIKNDLIAPENIKISIIYNEDHILEVTIPKGHREASFIDNTVTHFVLTKWSLLEGSDNTVLEGNENSVPISKPQIKEYQILEIENNTITIFVPKEDIIIFKDGIINQNIYKSNDQLIIIYNNSIDLLDRETLIDKLVVDPDTGITKNVLVSDETIHTKIGIINEEEIESLTKCPTEEKDKKALEEYESSVQVGIYSDNFIGLNSKLYNPVFKKRCDELYPVYDELLTIPEDTLACDKKFNLVVPDLLWIKQMIDYFIPVGTIMMFNDSSKIPPGWAICDGNNGTPDLRNRFIKGTDGAIGNSDPRGVTWDENNINRFKIEEKHLPKHTHEHEEHTHTISEIKGTVLESGDLTVTLNYSDYAWDVSAASTAKVVTSVSGEGVTSGTDDIDVGASAKTQGGYATGGNHTHTITISGGTISPTSSKEKEKEWANEKIIIEPKAFSLIFIMKIKAFVEYVKES